ncbi:hypothetical protein [Sphaerisporangium aureirubrum]|uniref:UDP-N-acetylglucosamine 2-epimerase domain-containing protein n=1 Tax=Sphaerisporangium aureirubrum TaxID=1544736 RepID=A0ABW1NUX2_9ACTN
MTYGEPPIRGLFSAGVTSADAHGVERTALVVAHHLAGAIRLADVTRLLESDHRVQLVYTVPPSSLYAAGAVDHVREARALFMPWERAIQTHFDLAVAAGLGALERVHAPVMTFAHGAGPNALVRRREGYGPVAARAVTGLGTQGLVMHGRVIPAAIMLGHENQRRLLASQCPEALPAAVVAGDLCFDRMLASRARRQAYRNALGAGPGRTLVVVSSHYAADSLRSRHPDLVSRLVAELPSDEYQLTVILHPNIWAFHGRKQVISWFDDLFRAGGVLLPPEEGWRAALIAADVMLSDRGSPACYAAALGVPILLAPYSPEDVLPGSQFALLGATSPWLDAREPLRPQLEAAMRGHPPTGELRALLTSVPSGAARMIRRTMYRLLRLDEPSADPPTDPVPLPQAPPLPAR